METFDYSEIIICLEQKKLFMTDILNMTKRIEVESKQEDVYLDELLSGRQNRIDRIKKCDHLISEKISDLDSDKKSHIESLLNCSVNEAENDDERKMLELSCEIKSLLERTRMIDKAAMQLLLEKREEIRKKLVDIHNEKMDIE